MDIPSISNLLIGRTDVAWPTQPSPDLADRRELVRAVGAVNQSGFFGEENELTFQWDRQSRKPIVRIVNRETHEVVRQIPAEYVLRLSEEFSRS